MPLRRRLRSSCSDRLHVLLVRLSTVGSRTFLVSGAAVWNDLPAHVTSAPSLAIFRQRIITFLFSHSYPYIVIWSKNYLFSHLRGLCNNCVIWATLNILMMMTMMMMMNRKSLFHSKYDCKRTAAVVNLQRDAVDFIVFDRDVALWMRVLEQYDLRLRTTGVPSFDIATSVDVCTQQSHTVHLPLFVCTM